MSQDPLPNGTRRPSIRFSHDEGHPDTIIPGLFMASPTFELPSKLYSPRPNRPASTDDATPRPLPTAAVNSFQHFGEPRRSSFPSSMDYGMYPSRTGARGIGATWPTQTPIPTANPTPRRWEETTIPRRPSFYHATSEESTVLEESDDDEPVLTTLPKHEPRRTSATSTDFKFDEYDLEGKDLEANVAPDPEANDSKLSLKEEMQMKYSKKYGITVEEAKRRKIEKRDRVLSIKTHVCTLVERQDFILKLAKALMTFGAPSHRLESQLNATAKVLAVEAQFIHIPSVVIASFDDSEKHTSETKFVKASGGLNLGMLHEVHAIYRAVIHDEMGVEEGSIALTRMMHATPIYSLIQRMAIAACCAGIIAPLGFGGSFVDAFVSGAFGAFLAFLQLYSARKNPIFSNIFEISIAALISFVSRGLSTTNYFCYEALSSAGVVLVLPGYIILCGSLELASKNLVAGSVRMVYAIIYTLFLGFSIAVGSDLYYLFDPASRQSTTATAASSYTLDGSFSSFNTTNALDFAGSFTFTNSSTTVNAAQASLQQGTVMCYRDPSWEWWRQSAGLYWLFLLVPAFSFFLSLWNLQPLRSRELPVMIVIAIIGYITNRLATEFIFNRSDIVSFIGATVIGLMGNMYSRIFKGTSFTAMATGVLFLVPSGIAAAGGLAMTDNSGGDSYDSGLMIGFRMVQVAIGITIGLFFASFLVYSVGSKKKSGGMGFAF